MKKIFILVYAIQLVAYLQGQTSGNQYNAMSNYVQPAPNAAALGKYVDYPVGYYTGTPNISVPIYNLKDGAASVAVSLSYHSSGIRVSETASWVGLGWALNAGGMVTRTVKGAPDEGSKISGTGTLPRGYWMDSGLTKMAHLPNPNSSGIITAADSSLQMTNYTIWQMSAGASDGEPDLFTFNFNGYSGKFVFDEKRVPRLLSDQDILISVNYDGATGNFATWLFTTPDGTKYYFGEGSKFEVNSTATGGFTDPNSTYPSSWMLTRIVYPNTKDTVYYNYTPETYSYFDLGQETKIYYGGVNGGSNTANACAINDPSDLPKNIYKTTVSGLRLTSIKSANYSVNFVATTQRQDIISGASNFPYSLDSVKVFNAAGQCIKQMQLSYAYFQSTTANNINTLISGPMAGDITDTKRLKLVSVKEFSGDGLIAKPPYTFSYQETLQLPRRISYDQDHWGFSNNYTGGSNNKFTPKVYHTICNNVGGSTTYANRQPRWPDMQAFTIKSIKDPLGVLTSFEFESHKTSQLYPDSVVGGLRVRKITTTDSVTAIVQTRLFDYGQGGVLYRLPQYLLTPVNEFYWLGNSWPIISTTYRGYAYDQNALLFLMKQSQSVVPLQDFQGNHIGYPIVKEIIGANGEGGSKVYYFMADQLVRGNSRLDMSNYTSTSTVTNGPLGVPETGLHGNGQWNQIAPENLVYYQGYNVDTYFPAAPPQVDFRRGQLLSEETYDSGRVLIRNVINTFRETVSEKNWIRGFKIFRVTHPTSNGVYDALTYYKLHTGISHPVMTVTSDYKDGKTMTSIMRYGYESAYHTQKTSDTTVNSLGDSIINKTYYSFDYTSAADNVFAKMKARNMLLPVSSRSWKNNQLVAGSITKYADFASSSVDTFVNPVKMYSLETSAPLTVAQAGENIALTSQFSTLIPNASFIEKANFNFNGVTGRIAEQKLINDKTQTMVWDNALRLPLAQVDNAYFSDIAYTSFETAEKGNWTFNSGSVVSEPTAPTGVKGYTVSAGISKSGLNTAQKYILSYWTKAGASVSVTGGTQTGSITGRVLNGWTYREVTITGTTSISLSGSGSVDEVRLHPVLAQMTTYTYDALLRLIATCSANNTISYYEYDSFNRLVDIKDQFGNIIKAFEYNYGQLSR
jgi:hypothetical protein